MNLRNVKGNGGGVIASRSVIPTFAGRNEKMKGKSIKFCREQELLPA